MLRIRPQTAEESASAVEVMFQTAVTGGAVDRGYFSAIEDGVRAELARGGKAGVRIVGVHVTLVGGSMHAHDSNERAFMAAGALAVRDALADLGLEVLEPWVRVEVVCPAEHIGTVIGSLSAKRAQVTEMVPMAQTATVRVVAPVAELFGYPVLLRSLTQGRGTCVMEPDGFRPVPQRCTMNR